MGDVNIIRDSWLSVTELNGRIRDLLEDGLPFIRVEAEISDLRAPPSGHLYFTLVDAESRIRAVVWRTTKRRLPVEPRSGDLVQITGRIAVYSPRGEYQLVVDAMQPVGSGDTRQSLLLLHARLSAEGLFDESRKKKLPLLPETIGVVTSKTGAAIQDIIRVLDDRFANYHLVLSPTLVQGDQAPAMIAAAMDRLVADGRSKVIICGRGGGSAEDLAAFNSEEVVRAIARSPIPVISAVGHEVDNSLADLAADCRAATPSAAAEQVLPEKVALEAKLQTINQQLGQAGKQNLRQQQNRLDLLGKRLQHPAQKIAHARLRCDDLGLRMFDAANSTLQPRQNRLTALTERLTNWPQNRFFTLLHTRLFHLQQQLQKNSQLLFTNRDKRHKALHDRLHAVSPQGVLQRGYAIVQDDEGRVIMDSSTLKAGDVIHTRLAKGTLTANITKTEA